LANALSDGGAQALQADAHAEQAAVKADAAAGQAGKFAQVANAAVAAAVRAAPSAPAPLAASAAADAQTQAAAAGTPRGDGAQASASALAALNAAAQLGSAVQVPSSGVEAAATYSAALPSPVGSAPWGQELGQQMLMAVDGKLQSATLHLNPPQLGPLEVQLQMQGGQVNAQFVSAHQAVRQAVESALPQLHDMFAGAGINLGQASVGTGSPRDGGSGGTRARSGASQSQDTQDAAPVAGAARTSSAWLRGLVNTYV
jgi:flagellar hook-length control protein FliK